MGMRAAQVASPHNITARHVDARWKSFVLLMPRVNVAVEQNHAAVVVIEDFEIKEVFLFRHDLLTVFF